MSPPTRLLIGNGSARPFYIALHKDHERQSESIRIGFDSGVETVIFGDSEPLNKGPSARVRLSSQASRVRFKGLFVLSCRTQKGFQVDSGVNLR